MRGVVGREASLLWLIRPKVSGKINRMRTDEARVFKALGLGFVGLFFWSFIFLVIWRMLLYFRNTQGILVSTSVGSVSATFTTGTSVLSATRMAMCVFAPSMEPMIAHTR